MRKFNLLALCVAAMMMLSITAVQAASAPGCDSADPNTSIMGVMQNQGDAMRVRDKAYARQIIKRNDPSLGMTCFDEAMGLTSRLGSIFSDVKSVTAAPSGVFTGAIDYTLGVDKLLINNLSSAVTPALSGYLDDFDIGSLSAALGAYITGALAAVTGVVNAAIAPILATITSVTGTLTTIQGYITTFNTIANSLSLPLPHLSVAPIIAALNAAVAAVQAMISTVMGTITAAISSLISTVLSQIMGPLTDLTCDNISNLWDDGNPTGGAVSIEGSGIETGTPYFTLDDLFGGSPAGVGAALLAELSTSSSAGILNKAASDLTTLLDAPKAAGGLPSWKRVPAGLNAASSVSAIIGLMNTP